MRKNILGVDLTRGKISKRAVDEKLLRDFIGGKGLGTAILYKMLKPKVDALSPYNRLLFMWGPLTGIAPGMTRYCLMSKSALTGAILHSYSGGHFPAEMAYSLPDCTGIVVSGKSPDWVYLKLEEGNASIEDAKDLVGKDIIELDELFAPRYSVACIGLAGENLVKFSTVSSDRGTHHAGRCGGGCVMGSKRLKAIAAKGKAPPVNAEVAELKKKHLVRFRTDPNTQWAVTTGTPGIIELSNHFGVLPTYHWTMGSFEHAGKIDAHSMLANSWGRNSCLICSVGCGIKIRPKEGQFVGIETEWGPEYETIAMNGANCGIGDLSAVATIATKCDRFGMDTITTGNVIGFTMECSQKGLINYRIDFGDAKKALELVEMIARREGIGDMLAEGLKFASKKIGGEAQEAAVHVKGLELPAYDPRGSVGMALAYATSDRGGCHNRAWPIAQEAFGSLDPFTIEGKAKLVADEQHVKSAQECLVVCDFTAYPPPDAVEFLNAVTGYGMSLEEYLRVGERIYNLTRLFNLREGFKRADDSLPKRFEKALKNAGHAEGKAIKREDFERMLDEYYEYRGWDKRGRPKKKTVERLGLVDYAA